MRETTFNNLHYVTKAFGLALKRKRYREPGMVYYLSFAGSNTACESLRASLHKKGARLPACGWSRQQESIAPGMASSKCKLPNSTELHYIMWDKSPKVIIVRDDHMLALRAEEGAHKWEDIEELERNHQPTLELFFAQAINGISKAPMLPEWAKVVMSETRHRGGWEELDVYGDVVHAIVINEAYEWTKTIGSLLENRRIAIPALPADLAELAAEAQRARLQTHITLDTCDTDEATEQASPEDPAGTEDKLAVEVAFVTLEQSAQDDNLPTALDALSSPPDKPFLFTPGQITFTPNFLDAVGPQFDLGHYLTRHLTGDWREQEMDAEDIEANQNAARATGNERQRVFSAFHYPDDGSVETPLTFWLITEWDRSVSTFLLPEDY